MEKIIFLGNGTLAEYSLAVLEKECQVVFHARNKGDLEEVKRLKRKDPSLHGVLASFGVIIKDGVLELFEPEGILNIHPSLLPKYRGASPIESAILSGETDFSVSVMKLAEKMDAGPIYFQKTLSGLPLDKKEIYRALAEAGAKWIAENLKSLPTPAKQNDSEATFCGKLEKNMGVLDPEKNTAEELYRKIVAFQGYPKPKYAFFGKNCCILKAHMLKTGEKAVLTLKGSDGQILAIDEVQPDGKKIMDAKSFMNGYGR